MGKREETKEKHKGEHKKGKERKDKRKEEMKANRSEKEKDKRKDKKGKVGKEKRGEEAEVETDVHTWSVLREALTGEHAHAPLESCTLASLFISLMCACVFLSGITGVCVCVCMSALSNQPCFITFFLCF